MQTKKIQRYQRMMARQSGFCWGMEYQPGIRAVRGEAPKGSRPSQLLSTRLRRVIHVLSTTERVFAQFGLYHPRLFELHEQRMLNPVSTVHPLYGHPLAVGMDLPPVLGTVEIAQALNCGHDWVLQVDEHGEPYVAPYPFLGDLLLFLRNDGGQPYCVNWTIKLDHRDFSEKNRTSIKSLNAQKRDRDKASLRQRIEREHYQAASIRTIELSREDLDQEFRFNLNFLFSWHGAPAIPDGTLGSDFDSEIKETILSGLPVNETVKSYSVRWGRQHEFLARLYQSIWERKISVDMFSPILIDSPFSIEFKDALDHYAHLFTEMEK